MHIPGPFRQDYIAAMHALMRAHPLATLVTLGPSGLAATHIPLADGQRQRVQLLPELGHVLLGGGAACGLEARTTPEAHDDGRQSDEGEPGAPLPPDA